VGDAWMPGAGRIRASADGGELRGGAPRVVWQTLETDPRLVSARSAAQCLDQLGRAPHLVWNPLTGEIVQLIPVLRAARSIGGPDGRTSAGVARHGEAAGTNAAGINPAGNNAAGINREGRLCVQIGVVGFAADPFTAGPMTGLELIVWWLDTWCVARSWPAGPPAPFQRAHGEPRSRRLWSRGGHFGGSQVPGCVAAGPGGIDVDRLTDAGAVPTIEVPRRTREVALQRRDKAAARAAGNIQFRHHQQEDTEAQLTSAG
jgi:hypothetical protein